jgi:release factor glutamine methyltransferase
MATLAKVLDKNSKLLNSKVDSETLLQHVLKKPRSHLYAWPEKELNHHQVETFQKLCNRRIDGEPIAYLTGEKEFYSRTFKVNPNTLIPRPETELLIDLILDIHQKQPLESILDLGTGSGIIAITLAKEIPNIQIDATDLNINTLDTAKKNAECLNAKIHFIHSNWYSSITNKKYSLIVSNPPYIEEQDLHLEQGDLRFEPLTALASGIDGMKDIESIIKGSKPLLTPKGILAIEHGYNQKKQVQKTFKKNHFESITTYKDLNNNDRVTIGFI